MSEQQPSESKYGSYIDQHFITSGPEIGRTRNTDVAVDMAVNESRARSDERNGRIIGRAVVAQEVEEFNKNSLFEHHPEHQPLLQKIRETKADADKEVFHDLENQVHGNYDQLMQDQKAYDEELLRQARNDAVIRHQANQ